MLASIGRYFHKRWANLSLQIKGSVLVLIPVVAMLGTVASVYAIDRQENAASNWVSHSQETHGDIEELLRLLVDAETGMRGYLLSGDDLFLVRFHSAQHDLVASLTRLRTHVHDYPDHQPRVERIEELSRRQLTALRRLQATTSLPTNQQASSRQALLRDSKHLMDSLRQDLNAMRADEDRLLVWRQAQMQMLRELTDIALVIGIFAGLVGGAISMLIFLPGIVRRMHQIEANAHRLALRQPLEPLEPGDDEIGRLGRTLHAADKLLAEQHQRLQDVQAFLEHLIASGPGVIFRAEPDTFRLTYVSPNIQRILGITADEALGNPNFWWEHLPEEDRVSFLNAMQATADRRGRSFEQVGRFIKTDGTTYWLQVALRIEYDQASQPASLIGYAHDVTDRKRDAEALSQAKEEAEQANRAKSEFLSRMSHELRTPLNAILGFGQILEFDPLPPEQAESVEQILKGGRHLLELINEVLDITRIETGHLSLSPEPVQVHEILREVGDLMAPLAAARHIRIDIDDAADDEYVLADRRRLRQVLLNLVANAIKYNRDGGAVGLTCTSHTGPTVHIDIRDTGWGIPSDKLGRLFNPFDRLGAEQTDVQGTGLGLTLAKRLMQAMGGTIDVDSRIGEGSTFRITLPSTESQMEYLDRLGTQAPPTVTGGITRTLLYVEDNLSNLTLIEHIVAHRPAVRLLTAMQGGLGLDLAREHRPDLIMLDVHLPDIPGTDVLHYLRADQRTQSIPVVVLSADATPGQIERLLAAGAYAYLTKPLDVPRFINLLDELLAMSGP